MSDAQSCCLRQSIAPAKLGRILCGRGQNTADLVLRSHFGAWMPISPRCAHHLYLKEALKRSIANWPIYAAVSSSAMAMATGASASIIGCGASVAPATASVRVAEPPLANAKGSPTQKLHLVDAVLFGASTSWRIPARDNHE